MRQQADVFLEANALAGLDQMLFAHAAVFGIVQEQIGEFPALLHHVNA